MSDVNSFFRTKLASKKKEDPLIDPGEAAEAALSFVYGPVSQTVIPMGTGYLMSFFDKPPHQYAGDPVYGMTKIRRPLDPSAEKALRLISDLQGVPFDRKSAEIQQSLLEGASELEVSRSGQQRLVPKKQSLLGGLFEVYPKTIAPPPYRFGIDPDSFEALGKVQKSVDSMIDRYKLPQKGVKIDLTSTPLSSFLGPRYEPYKKTVTIPNIEKAEILHEIGHAAHLTKPGARATDLMRKILHRGSGIAIPMAYIAGDEIQKMLPGTADDRAIEFVKNHAPAITAATYAAAELYPEVQATTRAVSHVYKTEGREAAKKVFKSLMLPMVQNILPIIPPIIGMAVAKKWYREAKEKKERLEKELSKEGGAIGDVGHFLKDVGAHAAHVLRQVGPQAAAIMEFSGKDFAKSLYYAGKNVVKSPSFAAGAATVGIPSAVISYASLGTPHGRIYTERLRELGKGRHESEIEYHKEKLDQYPAAPLIIGTTAAISGGFLAKMWSDILKVM